MWSPARAGSESDPKIRSAPHSAQEEAPSVATAGSAALTPWGHSPMRKKNSIQIRHAQLKYLSVGLKLKLNGLSDLILVTYPTLIMESLDTSGHTTVKTETVSRVSVKARTLAHESYCRVLGWLVRRLQWQHWQTPVVGCSISSAGLSRRLCIARACQLRQNVRGCGGTRGPPGGDCGRCGGIPSHRALAPSQ